MKMFSISCTFFVLYVLPSSSSCMQPIKITQTLIRLVVVSIFINKNIIEIRIQENVFCLHVCCHAFIIHPPPPPKQKTFFLSKEKEKNDFSFHTLLSMLCCCASSQLSEKSKVDTRRPYTTHQLSIIIAKGYILCTFVVYLP